MNADYSNVRFDPRRKMMCSIFPVKSAAWRDRGPTVAGGRTQYALEAAEKGSYVLVHTLTDDGPVPGVWDSFQSMLNPMTSEIGRPGWVPWPIAADDTVKDLMQEWVFSRLGGSSVFRPGIMIIAGDTPTPEELAQLETMQTGYAERMVNDAQHAAERQEINAITDVHRMLARWIGYRPPTGEANWVADIGTKKYKECVECYDRIDIRAGTCKTCKTKQPAITDVKDEVKAPLTLQGAPLSAGTGIFDREVTEPVPVAAKNGKAAR